MMITLTSASFYGTAGTSENGSVGAARSVPVDTVKLVPPP